jgi:hypothetical protein
MIRLPLFYPFPFPRGSRTGSIQRQRTLSTDRTQFKSPTFLVDEIIIARGIDMRILPKIFRGPKCSVDREDATRAKRQGPLVHVFVFDSGPAVREESKYVTTIVRSLLPEAMAYEDVPVSFCRDERMPAVIGRKGKPDIERATNYPFAWKKIVETDASLVAGLKAGREDFTFTWEEYDSERGNRGIVYAFYKLISRG